MLPKSPILKVFCLEMFIFEQIPNSFSRIFDFSAVCANIMKIMCQATHVTKYDYSFIIRPPHTTFHMNMILESDSHIVFIYCNGLPRIPGVLWINFHRKEAFSGIRVTTLVSSALKERLWAYCVRCGHNTQISVLNKNDVRHVRTQLGIRMCMHAIVCLCSSLCESHKYF